MRVDNLLASENIEDRRGDPARSYWQVLMDWVSTNKEEVEMTKKTPKKASPDADLVAKERQAKALEKHLAEKSQELADIQGQIDTLVAEREKLKGEP